MLTSPNSRQPIHKSRKPIGAYLVEAGLLSEAQVKVALTDQSAIPMRFGEILVTRGWVKQQTIEYMMQKIILPERKTTQTKPDLENNLAKQGRKTQEIPRPALDRAIHSYTVASDSKATTPAPTSKDQGGVNWIG